MMPVLAGDTLTEVSKFYINGENSPYGGLEGARGTPGTRGLVHDIFLDQTITDGIPGQFNII